VVHASSQPHVTASFNEDVYDSRKESREATDHLLRNHRQHHRWRAGCRLAGHARRGRRFGDRDRYVATSLEDNIYSRRGQLVDGNARFVERLVQMVREVGSSVATTGQARELIGSWPAAQPALATAKS